jgi:hypothetical protein
VNLKLFNCVKEKDSPLKKFLLIIYHSKMRNKDRSDVPDTVVCLQVLEKKETREVETQLKRSNPILPSISLLQRRSVDPVIVITSLDAGV